jgi:hypothetical protein
MRALVIRQLTDSLPTIGLVALSLMTSLYWLATTNADPDLWGFLAFGRLWWETGRFPYQDVFTFLPTHPVWVYHEWGAGILFFLLHHAGGFEALQLLKLAAGMALWGCMFWGAKLRGAGPVSVAVTFLLLHPLFVIGYSPVRPQIFTFFFFALTLVILEGARRTGAWPILLWLAPMQVVWCNLHGGFVAGLGLIFLYSLGEALCRRPWRPYAYTLALAGAATLINPYFFNYWEYIVSAVVMPRAEIREWASLWRVFQEDHPAITLAPLIIMLITCLTVLAARWRDVTSLLILGITLFLGVRHYRHLTLFFIVAGIFLPPLLTRLWRTSSHFRPLQSAAARHWHLLSPLILVNILLCLFIVGKHFIGRQPLSFTIPSCAEARADIRVQYPVGALEYIKRQGLSGNLLTEFAWGEFLLWNLYPGCRVALDGRYETVYPPEVATRYFAFFRNPGEHRQFLRDYPPALILVRARRPVAEFLRREPGWREVYTDTGSALFQRQ